MAPGIVSSPDWRSGAAQASAAMLVLKPRSSEARAEASTHMLVIIPQITTSSTPAACRSSASEVSRNAFACSLVISGSPSAGVTDGWISTPAVPGAKNGASGASQTCWMWKTGSPRSRNADSSSAARPAAASAPTSSIRPPGK
jgi:hypothetical protein